MFMSQGPQGSSHASQVGGGVVGYGVGCASSRCGPMSELSHLLPQIQVSPRRQTEAPSQPATCQTADILAPSLTTHRTTLDPQLLGLAAQTGEGKEHLAMWRWHRGEGPED